MSRLINEIRRVVAATSDLSERKAVVTFLRAQMFACFNEGVEAAGSAADHFYSMRDAYRDAADAIESGEHLIAQPIDGQA